MLVGKPGKSSCHALYLQVLAVLFVFIWIPHTMCNLWLTFYSRSPTLWHVVKLHGLQPEVYIKENAPLSNLNPNPKITLLGLRLELGALSLKGLDSL